MTMLEWGVRLLYVAMMAAILLALPFLAAVSFVLDPEAETYAIELQDFWEAWRGSMEMMK